jgi:gas vesicle protein
MFDSSWEETEMNRDRAVGFAIGLLAGAAISGTMALLYAPRPGKETRHLIKERAIDVAGAVKETTTRVFHILLVNKGVFDAGQIFTSERVYDLAYQNSEFTQFIEKSLNRHLKGDWGDVNNHDKQTNDQALKQGGSLRSAYNNERFTPKGVSTIWIITDADRSATTILFPDDH